MNIPLNIDWQQILLHLFNFALLGGGLYFLLYNPVKSFMEKREAYYKGMEEEALKKLEDVKKLEGEYKERLAHAEEEASVKVEKISKEAADEANHTIAEAKKQKERIITEAQEIAQREKQKAITEAKEEIVKLALMATKKMLNNEEGSCE